MVVIFGFGPGSPEDRAGRLSQAGYAAHAERFWRQLGVNPAGQPPAPASPGAPAPAQPVSTAAASPAPVTPTAADDRPSWISHLHELARLHDQGVLSDTAYTAAKRRILAAGQAADVDP